MQLIAKIEKKRYLRGMRSHMSSLFAFGQQRFTGLVLGNFFYISSHAGYEWNRKITSEVSHAIGFVRKREGGCLVKALCIRGLLDPVSLILMFLLCLGLQFIQIGMGLESASFAYWISIIFSLAVGLISAAQCCLTQNGEQTMQDLKTLLMNPIPIWEEE